MSDAHDLAHRHLAKVVESSDDAIVSKDLSSVIVSWNRAAERMFGYTAAEAIGRSIRMIIPADRQGEEDVVLEAIHAGRSMTHYETVRQRKDGSLIDISLTVSPIRDDAGVVVGASKIARDITEQVRLRRQAREHAEITEKLSEVGVGGRVVARSRHHRPEGHRHGERADDGGVRRVLLQRARRRLRRRLHALHAVGRAQGSVRASSRIRGRRRSSRRRSTARGPSASTTSPRIRASARTRRTTACRRDTCRCAATWPCRCGAAAATSSAACSSAAPASACSPSSTSGSPTASPAGRRWRWRTPGCSSRPATPTA